MTSRIDLFDSTYRNFSEHVMQEIRAETFGRALIRIEREERFDGLQQFFGMVHRLTNERRLARIVYLVENPAH